MGKALGEELNRTSTVVVPKLKDELEESTSSLKAALEAAEKMQQNDRMARKEQEPLKATLTQVMAERDRLLKEKDDVKAKEESLIVEDEKC